MRKKAVKGILFDLDGVLIDSIDAWHAVFNDTLQFFGKKKLSKKEFIKGFGSPIEKDMEKMFFGKTLDEVVHRYNLNFMKNILLVELFDHTLPLLKEVRKRKLKTALISNSTRVIVNAILSKYKLKRYFDVTITLNDVKKSKPAPDGIFKACRMIKIRPSETIFVGDTQNDMIAGKRAGCMTVGFKTKGDRTISDLKLLLNMI